MDSKKIASTVLYAVASAAAAVGALTQFSDVLPKALFAWCAVIAAAGYAAASVIERQRPPRSSSPPGGVPRALLALFFGSLLLSGCGGSKDLLQGYRAVYVTERAGETTEKALGEAIKRRRAVCEAASDAHVYQECMAKAVRAGTQWQQYIKPGINTALSATFAMLEEAYPKKDTDWESRLKRGLCPLIEAIDEWKHLLGDDAEKVLVWLRLVKGVVCK